MPVKKLKPSYIANTGYIPSSKSDNPIQYESFLERNLVALLEEDSAVKRIEEYPIQVHWIDPIGIQRRYTPDLLIEYTDDRIPLIIEVKSRNEIRNDFEFLKFKYRAVKPIIQGMGYRFKVVTEKKLTSPYIENILFLKRYKSIQLDHYTMEDLKEGLQHGPMSVTGFLDKYALTAEDQIKAITTIWGAIVQGKLCVDLTKKITNSTLISLYSEAEVDQ